MTILKSLLTGFAFILFSSVLLAVYVYAPETYESLGTDAVAVSSYLADTVEEHLPETPVSLDEVVAHSTREDAQQLTLASIMSTTTSYHCSVSFSVTSSQQGTVLVGEGNVHAIFNREIGNRSTETHVIKNADGIYVWNEGLDGLFFKALGETDVLSDAHELLYTCSPQTLSSDAFRLPENIKFYTR